MKLRLPDPNHCPKCSSRGRVIASRNSRGGWKRRRLVCPARQCGWRWTNYETLIHPKRLIPMRIGGNSTKKGMV